VVAEGPPAEVLTRGNLRLAFEIEAQTFAGPDGELVVVPDLAAPDENAG
jgi:ABC-type cobalamin/Fe3+-siderophores transport system ATPase subunit